MDSTIKIEIKEWNYRCGDGCCDTFGTSLIINGDECINSNAGGDVYQALEFLLQKLNVKYEISLS